MFITSLESLSIGTFMFIECKEVLFYSDLGTSGWLNLLERHVGGFLAQQL